MSTDFSLSKRIQASDLLEGRLERFGVRQKMNDETSEKTFCLTEGHNNFLWVYIDDEGFVSCLTRYMPNGNPDRILEAIADAFDVDIFSEYEPQFWGFDTQEEWDTWEAAAAKEDEDKFHADLVKYVKCAQRHLPGHNR